MHHIQPIPGDPGDSPVFVAHYPAANGCVSESPLRARPSLSPSLAVWQPTLLNCVALHSPNDQTSSFLHVYHRPTDRPAALLCKRESTTTAKREEIICLQPAHASDVATAAAAAASITSPVLCGNITVWVATRGTSENRGCCDGDQVFRPSSLCCYSAIRRSLSRFAHSLAVGGSGGCASFRFRLGPPFLHERMQPQSPPPPPQKRMQIFRVRTRKVSLLIHQHSGVRACVACESAMGAGSAWCMTAVASGWSGRCNANGMCACWDCKSFRFLLRFSSLLVLVEERILIVRSAAALSGCRRAALAQPTTVCC